MLWISLFARFIWVGAVPENPSVSAGANVNAKSPSSHTFGPNQEVKFDEVDVIHRRCEIEFDIIIDAIQQSRPNRNTSNVLLVFAADVLVGSGCAECCAAWSIDTILRRLHASGKAVLLRRLAPEELYESSVSTNNSGRDDVPATTKTVRTTRPLAKVNRNAVGEEEEENDETSTDDTEHRMAEVHSNGNSSVFYADWDGGIPRLMSSNNTIVENPPSDKNPPIITPIPIPAPSTNVPAPLFNLPPNFSILLALPRNANLTHSATINRILTKNPSLVKIMLQTTSTTAPINNSNSIHSDLASRPKPSSSNNGRPHGRPTTTKTIRDELHSKPSESSSAPDEARWRFKNIAWQLWRSHRMRNLYYVSTPRKYHCANHVARPNIMANRRNVDNDAQPNQCSRACCADAAAAADDERVECLQITAASSANETESRRKNATNPGGNGRIGTDGKKQQNQVRKPADVCVVSISSDILAHDPFDSSSSASSLLHPTAAIDAAADGDDDDDADATGPNESAGSLLWHPRRTRCVAGRGSTTSSSDEDSSDCRDALGGSMAEAAAGVIGIGDFNEFLRRTNRIDFQRTQLNISFFPATMAYLKRSSGYYRKQFKWWAGYARVSDRGDHLCPSGGDDCPDAYFGADVETVKELALRMNFTPNLISAADGMKYGWRLDDGEFCGSLGDLLNNRAEVIMNGYFIKYYETTELEFTAGLYSDKLCFIIRAAQMVPEEWLILNLFTPTTWAAIAITLLGSSVVYAEFLTRFRAVNQRSRSMKPHHCKDGTSAKRGHASVVYRRFTDQLTVHLRFVGMMLSKPGPKLGQSMAEHVFIGICFMWSIVLTGIFQGSLYNVYSHPKTFANINTVDEMANANLGIAVRFQDILIDIFGKNEDDKKTEYFKRNIKIVSTESDVYETVRQHEHLADTDRLINYRLVLLRYMQRNGFGEFHLVNECPKSYVLAQMVRKNANHLDQLNGYLLRFLAAGLVEKWFAETETIFFMENRAYQIEHSEAPQQTVLGIRHLWVGFLSLMGGLSLSAGFFVTERWIL